MRIIGTGFGRTGTTSIQRALGVLGYRAYNFETVMHNQHFDAWRELVNGKAPEWDALFDGYDATISWPACFFYKELYKAYPDAKFILTWRDPERWADSVLGVIHNFPKLKKFRFVPRVRAMLGLVETLLIPKFGSFEPEREHLINLIKTHSEEVIAFFPPEKLLVYEVKEGWEPLCRFLGHDVPAQKFPYENRGDAFIQNLLSRFIRGDST